MAYFAVAVLLGLAGALAYWRFLYSPAPTPPTLSAPVTAGRLRTETGERTFSTFVPATYAAGAPLLLVLHGSNSDAEHMRYYTGYEFERLAEQFGFMIAYPEGYQGYWNDCRIKGGFATKKLGIDDVGFLRALVNHLREVHGTGPVFAAGYSNGAQMCFRLALEAPGETAGIAVFAANFPTDDNCVTGPPARPVSIMLINGTRDPINPYSGGRVTIFGFGDRGTVRSAPDSAAYFVRHLGEGVRQEGPVSVVPAAPGRDTSVDRISWTAPAGEVTLYTVTGGGHVVPQPHYRFPRLIGPTETAFNAPAECWAFFSRLAPRVAGNRTT